MTPLAFCPLDEIGAEQRRRASAMAGVDMFAAEADLGMVQVRSGGGKSKVGGES